MHYIAKQEISKRAAVEQKKKKTNVLIHEFVSRWNMLTTFKRAHFSSLKHAFYVDQVKHLNAYIFQKRKNQKCIPHRNGKCQALCNFVFNSTTRCHTFMAFMCKATRYSPPSRWRKKQLFNSHFNLVKMHYTSIKFSLFPNF